MKAAFPAEYYDLRSKLKDFRYDAVENDDDEVLDIIGNYTHDSVNVMRAKVEDVEALLAEREEKENETESEFYVAPQPASWVTIASTEDRLFEIEYALGIRNTANAQRFNQRALEEAKHATKK
jgi:hypothetical protein